MTPNSTMLVMMAMGMNAAKFISGSGCSEQQADGKLTFGADCPLVQFRARPWRQRLDARKNEVPNAQRLRDLILGGRLLIQGRLARPVRAAWW